MAPARWRFSALAQRDKVRKQSVSAGNARGQLSKPGQAGVNHVAAAVCSDQNPALERRFVWVFEREDRLEVLIPLIGKINASLLHPAIEVGPRDFVGRVERRMVWKQKRHGRLLVGHPLTRETQVVRSESLALEALGPVVLHDQVSTGLSERE